MKFFLTKTLPKEFNLQNHNSKRRRRKINIIEKMKPYFSYGGNYFLGNIHGVNIIDKGSINISKIPLILKNIFLKLSNHDEWPQLKPNLPNLNSQKLSDFGFMPLNPFEEFISNFCLVDIPESFSNLTMKQPSLHKVKCWIGNISMTNENEILSIARIIEKGGKWFSVQHGGVYGHVRKNAISNIEYKLTDGFISWGWSKSPPYTFNNIILPSPHLSKLSLIKKNRFSKNILFVGTISYLIPKRYSSDYETVPIELYKDVQFKFIKLLTDELKAITFFRDHPGNTNKSHAFYNYIKNIEIKSEPRMALIAAQDYKLIVVDHCSTTFLQSFVMNTPTIIFWPPNYIELNEVAQLEFNKLKEVGVWHNSPESAANFINNNFKNIDIWWNSEVVQDAIINFNKKYALTSKNYKYELTQLIKKLSVF
jgi:putative transferase (TIGR04331 family)